MKLQRLAGYGPIAAFVSAGSLLVYFILTEVGTGIAASAPSLLVPLVIALTLAQFLWVAGLAVVVFDLARLEHPKIGAAGIRIANAATLIALVMPIPIAIAPFTVGVDLQAPAFLLLYLGVATSLLVDNLEARRAMLLRGALRWLGVGTGVLYAIAGLGFIGILLPTIGMTVFMVGFNVVLFAEVLYMVWAVWMGVHLIRSKAAATAPAMA